MISRSNGQVRRRRGYLTGDPHDGPSNPDKTVAEERAFRRGYDHAAAFVVAALENGATAAELKAWVEGDVWDWRTEDFRRVVGPPLPPRHPSLEEAKA